MKCFITFNEPQCFIGLGYCGTIHAPGLNCSSREAFAAAHHVLYWMPQFLYERYGKPVVITENGISNGDLISLDGKIHDGCRIAYLERYLQKLGEAAELVPIMGYFHWSLMDNFEWACGYQERFGLVYVDYQTQERIMKDSGCWYADVIRTNGECLF